MAITIKDPNQDSNPTGITTGNEFIWEVLPNTITSLQGIVTSAGTARVRYSLQETAPTDFTNFVNSEIGDHTATFGETTPLASGIKWIGLEVDSGTWSVNIKQTKVR